MEQDSKDGLIVKLRKEGTPIRKIAKITHSSNTRIEDVLLRGGVSDSASKYSEALKLFSEGKMPLEVSILLSLPSKRTIEFYNEFLDLNQMGTLARVYREIGSKGVRDLLIMHKVMIEKGIRPEDLREITSEIALRHKLKQDVDNLKNEKSILINETTGLRLYKGDLKKNIIEYQKWNKALSESNDHFLDVNRWARSLRY